LLQEVAKPIHERLLTRQVLVSSNVQNGMDSLMAESLLPMRAFDGTQDVNAVMFWQPDADAVFAMSPL
jgi:hypothetical protein